MARLCVLGSALGPLFDAIRPKNQAALRSLSRASHLLMPALIPRAHVRPFTASQKGSRLPVRLIPRPSRLLMPASISCARVRSLAESQKGSRLPVRSPPPVPARPALRPSSRFTSLLEERKAPRQARSRPWVGKLKSLLTIRSNLSSASPDKPSKPEIHATHTKKTARVDKVHAKPAISVKGPSKDKSAKKCVRFGKTSVVSVTRWIERQDDVFDGPPVAMGHLKGWSVTSLLEPDEDGEEEKYITYWGSGSFFMMTSNHTKGPPDRCGCPWSALAWFQARHPTWRPKTVFEAWRRERERILEQKEIVFPLSFCCTVISCPSLIPP